MPMHLPDSVSLNFPANLIVHSDYIFSINYLIHGTTYDILCEIDHAVSIGNSKYRLFQKTIINNILTHSAIHFSLPGHVQDFHLRERAHGAQTKRAPQGALQKNSHNQLIMRVL